MKFLMITLSSLVIAPLIASAAEIAPKPRMNVDFNSMIEATRDHKIELAQEVSEHLHKKPAPVKPQDEQTVVDFIDMEIGWGEAPKLVDRRFNSVGETIVVE